MQHLEIFLLFLALNMGFSALSLSLLFFIKFKEHRLISFFLFLLSLTLFFITMFLDSYFRLLHLDQSPEWINYVGLSGGVLFFLVFPFFIRNLLSLPSNRRFTTLSWSVFVIALLLSVMYTIQSGNKIWTWSLIVLQMGYSLAGVIYVLKKINTLHDIRLQKGIRIFIVISAVYIVWQIADYSLGERLGAGQDLWALPVYYSLLCLLSILFMINMYFQARLLENGVLNQDFIRSFSISPREQEIISLLVQGKSNKEISELLFISFKTVENHIYNIYQKCEVKNRLELFNLAQKYS